MSDVVTTLLRYKTWANKLTFASLSELSEEELLRPRKTNFTTMAGTINHVYVVDDIFRHHLTGQAHGYTSRNTAEIPALADLWERQQEMDAWYEACAAAMPPETLTTSIDFLFVGGGEGRMSPLEIFLHVVNHGTYHRGFVSDMMYQVPVKPTPNDLPVFLRDQPA